MGTTETVWVIQSPIFSLACAIIRNRSMNFGKRGSSRVVNAKIPLNSINITQEQIQKKNTSRDLQLVLNAEIYILNPYFQVVNQLSSLTEYSATYG
jgi:hypothetical protein